MFNKYFYILLLISITILIGCGKDKEGGSADCSFTEQNCDKDCARELTLGEEMNGKIDTIGDKDFYWFEVTTPGVIEVDILSAPNDIALEAYLKTYPQCTELLDETADVGEGFQLLKLADTGTYMLQVEERGNNNFSAFEYTIRVRLNTEDVYELNNDCGNAKEIPLSTKIEGAIYPRGDVDYYKFKTDKPGVITVNLTNVPDEIEMLSKLFNYPDCLELKAVNGDEEEAFSYRYLAPAGEYAVGFGFASVFGSWGYNSAFYSFEVSLDTSDVYEMNNDCQTAAEIPLNTEIHAAIGASGDHDFFKFEIPSAGNVIVDVLSVPGDFRLRGTLRTHPQCNELKEVNGNKGEGFQVLKSVEPGMYVVNFERSFSGSFYHDNFYTFRILLEQ